jgi:hypothetical protein
MPLIFRAIDEISARAFLAWRYESPKIGITSVKRPSLISQMFLH